ncbi:MAG TPA: hypothetical protein V6D10_07010 [Trichocoleus sp.]|jgi:hypothetical protein
MLNLKTGDWVGYYLNGYARAIVIAIFPWGVQVAEADKMQQLHWEDVCTPF